MPKRSQQLDLPLRWASQQQQTWVSPNISVGHRCVDHFAVVAEIWVQETGPCHTAPKRWSIDPDAMRKDENREAFSRIIADPPACAWNLSVHEHVAHLVRHLQSALAEAFPGAPRRPKASFLLKLKGCTRPSTPPGPSSGSDAGPSSLRGCDVPLMRGAPRELDLHLRRGSVAPGCHVFIATLLWTSRAFEPMAYGDVAADRTRLCTLTLWHNGSEMPRPVRCMLPSAPSFVPPRSYVATMFRYRGFRSLTEHTAEIFLKSKTAGVSIFQC